MNQVFISNHMAGINASAHDWSDLVHTTGATGGATACMVGVWNPVNDVFLDGVLATNGLISPLNIAAIGEVGKGWPDVMDGEAVSFVGDADGIAVGDEAINVLPSSPQWLNRAFQLVQAMPSGNAIASPIIHTNQVKRLRWDPNVPPAAHALQLGTDAGVAVSVGGVTTPVVTDIITVILNVRFPQDILFYESQVNPGGAVTNLTPTLSAAFDNPQRVYKIEVVAGSTTATTVSDNITTAINAHGTLNKLVTASNGTGGVILTAKLFGMVLDCSYLKEGTAVSDGLVIDSADMVIGVGSYAEVLSAEKKAQYSQGHLNRMYLPTGGVTSASATAGGLSSQTVLYNRLVIEYGNANGGMPGFNNGGNTSTATLYVPKATYVNQGTQRAVEATFGLINATVAKEFVW